jgi:hypothetical protein
MKKFGVDLDEADQEVYEAAKKIIEDQEAAQPVTSEDIQFVFSAMKKEAPYDEVSIRQLFYGMCSGFTKVPIHHNVNSKVSGAGKSYLLVLVAGYLSDKYVILLTGMSNKALLHEQGVQVIEDKSTGEVHPVGQYINEIEVKIEELQEKRPLRKEDKQQIKKLQTELDEAKSRVQNLIILNNRIILILDTPQQDLFNALMSMISQDTQKDQKYEFVDRSSSGSLRTKINRLRGTPVIFTCQVIDDTRQIRFHEKNRRFIHITPDTSNRKIGAAIDLIGLKHGLLPDEYDEEVVSRQDKENAKKIVSRIVSKLINHSKPLMAKESGVKIPFTKAIGQAIINSGYNDVWQMTIMDRLMRYLGIITKINIDSRPKLVVRIINEDEGNEEEVPYPIATFEDLKETLQLMGMASSTIRPYIAHWYNNVFIPAFESLGGKPNSIKTEGGYTLESETHVGVNTQQLAEKTKEILGKKPGSDELLKSYLYPLLNLGIIDKVRSTINGKANIYFPVEDGNIFSLFQDDKDLRLIVRHPSLYPSKKVLENEFRTFIKYYSNGDVLQKTDKKYKLVDVDGKEITLDELLIKHLNHPEICFKEGYSLQQKQQYIAELEQRPVSNNLIYSQQLAQKNAILIVHPTWSNIPRQFDNNVIEEPGSGQTSTGGIRCCNYFAEGETAVMADSVQRKTTVDLICEYCHILDLSCSFSNFDAKERHVIKKHPGWTAYPGPPDLHKFECRLKERRREYGSFERH